LLSDGTAKCWGYNYHGQLGDGTNTNRYTPVSVSGLTNAVAIAAGGDHTCALLSDGTAKCWGYNYHGQLGDGTNTNRYTPVSVLNYNLGGRYDKTNGIPATIQKPPYFQDTYFIRKYASPEPTTSVGNEESLTISLLSSGNPSASMGNQFTAIIYLTNGTIIQKDFSLDNNCNLGKDCILGKSTISLNSNVAIDKIRVCSKACSLICNEYKVS
jgi:alpha-tubulin suppressor-like RCC1 family protein